jgi:stress response protein SCP2
MMMCVALDDLFHRVRLEVDHRNAAGRGDDHFFAVRRERVQVEIKALAARLGGKLHDAMAVSGQSIRSRREFASAARHDAGAAGYR